MTVDLTGGCDSFILWLSIYRLGARAINRNANTHRPVARPSADILVSIPALLNSDVVRLDPVSSRTLIATGEIPRGAGNLFPYSLVLIEGGMNWSPHLNYPHTRSPAPAPPFVPPSSTRIDSAGLTTLDCSGFPSLNRSSPLLSSIT